MEISTILWMLAVLILLVFIYYFINRKNIRLEENKRKKMNEHMSQKMSEQRHSTTPKKATPQALQAYERLMILIDRISISKLVNRVQPISTEAKDYADFLIKNVEQEFDFNTSQELYVSKEAWSVVDAAKNAVIQDVLKTALSIDSNSAYDLQSSLLKNNNSQSLVTLAKDKLREDVSSLV